MSIYYLEYILLMLNLDVINAMHENEHYTNIYMFVYRNKMSIYMWQ